MGTPREEATQRSPPSSNANFSVNTNEDFVHEYNYIKLRCLTHGAVRASGEFCEKCVGGGRHRDGT